MCPGWGGSRTGPVARTERRPRGRCVRARPQHEAGAGRRQRGSDGHKQRDAHVVGLSGILRENKIERNISALRVIPEKTTRSC